MSDRKNIFPEETELSEIVLNKTNHAFEMIKKEEIGYMKETNRKGSKYIKKQAAVIAGICILAVSSISATAAIHHYWGRGMQGNLQASDTEQRELTENGIAKVCREDPDYQSLAVTINGITIVPDTIITDGRFAHMSFRISGYNIAEGEDPGFDRVNVYQGEDSENLVSRFDMGGRMYDGTMPGENMKAIYDDGSPLEFDEDGNLIRHYTDSNGDIEYIINISNRNQNDSLLGKSIHVELKDLGISEYSFDSEELIVEFITKVEGSWNFDIVLPDVSSARDVEVGQEIEGTCFVLERVSISPISMKIDFSVIESAEITGDAPEIPTVLGVVLKDGTRIPNLLSGGGGFEYTGLDRTAAYQYTSYYRVIDVDDVAALIVLPYHKDEQTDPRIEIPISN